MLLASMIWRRASICLFRSASRICSSSHSTPAEVRSPSTLRITSWSPASEVGADDVLGISFRLRLGQAHAPRCPFAEQAVAAGNHAELHFLVAGEFGFKGALAVVELCHLFPTKVSRGEIGLPPPPVQHRWTDETKSLPHGWLQGAP